ncbi:MAG: hypothetical protein V4850_08600 [Myxococcota bacterium]
MSVDLDIAPMRSDAPTWAAVAEAWARRVGDPRLLGPDPKLCRFGDTVAVPPNTLLVPPAHYFLTLPAPSTLSLSVRPNEGNLDEAEYLEDYGRNLAPAQLAELTEGWRRTGRSYGISSLGGRSTHEPELFLALACALADVSDGRVIVMNDGILTLGVGVYTANEFAAARWPRAGVRPDVAPWACVYCGDPVLPLHGQHCRFEPGVPLPPGPGHAHLRCAREAGHLDAWAAHWLQPDPTVAPPGRIWRAAGVTLQLEPDTGLLAAFGPWGRTAASPAQWRARRGVEGGAALFRGHAIELDLAAFPDADRALAVDLPHQFPIPLLTLFDLVGGGAHLAHPELLAQGTLSPPKPEARRGTTWPLFVSYHEFVSRELDVALSEVLPQLAGQP